MKPAIMLTELTRAGIRLTADGDRLHVECKPGTATPELRQRLIDHKAELLSLIRIRDRLLTISRELGLPDALVLELPENELRATAEQTSWMVDAEIAHQLLVFYLRSMAGIEPALPGSLAERQAPAQQARVQQLRQRETKP